MERSTNTVTLLTGSASKTFAQRNNQEGLVNVNIQDLGIQIPVSVALPIGVAANVCGVNELAIQQASNECDAQNTSQAMSRALAQQLIG
jgi:hypothetical protein